MPRRKRDAILRNSRQLKQQRLDIPKPKMPKKGTTITIKYTDEENKEAEHAKEVIERLGYKCEMIKDGSQ